jgi:peptide/nickel transport system substrate-binding protein
MNNTSNDLVTMAEDNPQTLINTEWRLADMVDAIAAEIDRAEDTLALKSYARGMSFAIKQLSLDLQVAVRRDADGNIKFRTAEPNATGSTTLKLDFAQILQNQLSGNRRKLDEDVDPRPLDALGLTSEEIRRLNAISIYSSDDLRSYTQTAATIAEVSRKTSIEDARLRQVLGLPYLEALKPGGGLPGSLILLEGGNFGAVRPSQASVYFQGVAVSIVAWTNARIQVQIPANATGSGVIFLVINDRISNTIDWEAVTVDLIVKDITITPSNPKANEEITLTASLANQGSGEASAFTVQWSIDGEKQTPQPHGVLPPNQASQESSLVWKIRLTAGEHQLSFTADPDQKLADLDRANSTFTKTITVAAAQTSVNLGDYSVIDSLDPFTSQQPWELRQDVLNLVYRGLMRFDPNKRELSSDLSCSSQELVLQKWGTPIVRYELRQDVRFHDGSALTAEDVVFSYKRASESSTWSKLLKPIISIGTPDSYTLIFNLSDELLIALRNSKQAFTSSLNDEDRETASYLYGLLKILTLPIVPARVYKSEPKRFITNPVGCGPFIAELNQNGKSGIVQLKAFEQYYLGTPRLQNLSIALEANINVLIQQLVAGELNAIKLPDSEDVELAKKLKSLEDKYQIIRHTTPIEGRSVVYVQDRSLRERLPNNYETNWNAHLWYISRCLKGLKAPGCQ